MPHASTRPQPPRPAVDSSEPAPQGDPPRRGLSFLHAADLHLDSPLRGLGLFEGAPVERLRGATRQAFEALVDLALGRAVDLLLLAGDIFDGDWKDFSTGLFYRGQLVRLHNAGVQVFVIHGNHDALSQITRELPPVGGVHVFAADRAESVVLHDKGVVVHGRSFGQRAQDRDLVPSYPMRMEGLFNIGMLHTSLAGTPEHDTYAPTTEQALAGRGYDYFALGHIHARRVVRESDPRIVFCGNLQGRHARETGPKGCELVQVQDGAIVHSEFVPLDTVRWHQLTLTVDPTTDEAALRAQAAAQLQALAQPLPEHLHAVRVHIEGDCALAATEAMQPGYCAALLQSVVQDLPSLDLWLESVRVRMRPQVDRGTLEGGDDALAELLRLCAGLRELARNSPDEARAWLKKELGPLPPLPSRPDPELAQQYPEAMDAEALSALIDDAEATLLAQLRGAA